MPITINGSGTVTGISAGGLPDGVITTDDIAANAVTYAKIGTTEQGQLCKAWVNFNGTGTVAIRQGYNVSSITDNGTGDYTINFTNAMPDANYGVAGTASGSSSRPQYAVATAWDTAPTASALRVYFGATGSDLQNGANYDSTYVSIAIFR